MSEDVILIRSLLKMSRVDIYDLHKKYRLSPAQLSSSIQKLKSLRAICVDNGSVTFTETGLDWVLKNRSDIFMRNNGRYWSKLDSTYRYSGPELHEIEYYNSISEILSEGER